MDFIDSNIHKGFLDSIHGYGFSGVQRDKPEIICMYLSQIEECIGLIDKKLEYYCQKYVGIINHLIMMIGITQGFAVYFFDEIGTDMTVWRDDVSLACWVGFSPANNAGMGKKNSTRIGNEGHYLKPLPIQCALAAVRSTKKDPYFCYKYERLKKRRGHKKAIIAIARKMLVAIYRIIGKDEDFHPVEHRKVIQQHGKAKRVELKECHRFLQRLGHR